QLTFDFALFIVLAQTHPDRGRPFSVGGCFPTVKIIPNRVGGSNRWTFLLGLVQRTRHHVVAFCFVLVAAFLVLRDFAELQGDRNHGIVGIDVVSQQGLGLGFFVLTLVIQGVILLQQLGDLLLFVLFGQNAAGMIVLIGLQHLGLGGTEILLCLYGLELLQAD